MTTTKQQNGRASESGNVLFLILIAVALFAALSYAVTQSSRSGGGDTGEKTLVSSSQITQYPASVRTSIVRMVIAGTAVDDLAFDDPSLFTANLTTDALKARGVFYPSPPGGGATYQNSPPDAMSNGAQGNWIFTANYAVQNIGSNVAGAGNDVIAFLPGITKGLCAKLDSQLGITMVGGVPPTGDIATPTAADNLLSTSTFPTSLAGGNIIGNSNTVLIGQPFGCFVVGTGASAVYTYYHVLVER